MLLNWQVGAPEDKRVWEIDFGTCLWENLDLGKSFHVVSCLLEVSLHALLIAQGFLMSPRLAGSDWIAQVGSFQDLQKGEVADELEADENLGRGFSDTRYVIW